MKAKYLGILVLVFSFYLSNAHPSDTTCFKEISCDDFYLLKETQDVFIIDVRFYKDYKKERINRAHTATDKEQVVLLLEGIDKYENLYVYCYVGVKSKMMCKFICKELEFINVYSIKGGIGQWKKKGFSIDKTKIKKEN